MEYFKEDNDEYFEEDIEKAIFETYYIHDRDMDELIKVLEFVLGKCKAINDL
ncbi:hypothetical protein [Lysinibacillus sp. Bpr_S20]|uniref:hypothetical protein n=1 Tax=Lysinibacillus sp. Bpr_S20 TaxID=2933964 RepID=UPI0020117C03|nr:hypothetical protein [Lysinibacillus sp. Bpr_S20]MCL1700779.1 hypothetical protein [Lysinibacillus sp. Bpr_S20]